MKIYIDKDNIFILFIERRELCSKNVRKFLLFNLHFFFLTLVNDLYKNKRN